MVPRNAGGWLMQSTHHISPMRREHRGHSPVRASPCIKLSSALGALRGRQVLATEATANTVTTVPRDAGGWLMKSTHHISPMRREHRGHLPVRASLCITLMPEGV
eukprot:CAMPEP_0171983488 /NCGR_PEP_ID=MMETSP0993-20121228/273330_1 /TAXON_ID=483369 /ORGANISM="non described non described, Strain CCMP2098" /LENGTH=104 /DNA_ID=CAMNT_0012636261 /DNA_START=301 /DNA_END=615 /DNA_ORIENTATION=+